MSNYVFNPFTGSFDAVPGKTETVAIDNSSGSTALSVVNRGDAKAVSIEQLSDATDAISIVASAGNINVRGTPNGEIVVFRRNGDFFDEEIGVFRVGDSGALFVRDFGWHEPPPDGVPFFVKRRVGGAITSAQAPRRCEFGRFSLPSTPAIYAKGWVVGTSGGSSTTISFEINIRSFEIPDINVVDFNYVVSGVGGSGGTLDVYVGINADNIPEVVLTVEAPFPFEAIAWDFQSVELFAEAKWHQVSTLTGFTAPPEYILVIPFRSRVTAFMGEFDVSSPPFAAAALRVTKSGSGDALLVRADDRLDSVTFRVTSDGKVRVGGTPVISSSNVQISTAITGSTSYLHVYANPVIQRDVTVAVNLFTAQPSTVAAPFTLGSLAYYHATQGSFGAGAVVTTQSGFSVSNTLVGATNNYAYRSLMPSGNGRWNLYMEGTANNYLAGRLLIGTGTDNGYKLNVTDSSQNLASFTGVSGMLAVNDFGSSKIGLSVLNGATLSIRAGVNEAIQVKPTGEIIASITGGATTATRWQSPRTITLTGDVSGVVSIDGSQDVTISTTLIGDLSPYPPIEIASESSFLVQGNTQVVYVEEIVVDGELIIDGVLLEAQ